MAANRLPHRFGTLISHSLLKETLRLLYMRIKLFTFIICSVIFLSSSAQNDSTLIQSPQNDSITVQLQNDSIPVQPPTISRDALPPTIIYDSEPMPADR